MTTYRLHVPVILLGCALTLSAKPEVPAELTFDDVSYRTSGLYRGGRGEFFHVEYVPSGQTSTKAATAVECFRQPLSTDRLDQLIEVHLETMNSWTPKGVLTVIEKSERFLVLKDVRFDGTLSGSPLFGLYIYELRGRTLLSGQLLFHPRPPYDTAESFSKEFTAKGEKWLMELRRVTVAVQESLDAVANKSGAANGSQPIRSETNRTSSAAGSPR